MKTLSGCVTEDDKADGRSTPSTVLESVDAPSWTKALLALLYGGRGPDVRGVASLSLQQPSLLQTGLGDGGGSSRTAVPDLSQTHALKCPDYALSAWILRYLIVLSTPGW